jgi:hypothetical protein
MEFTNYNYGHDEYSNSTHALNRWLWSRDQDAQWLTPVSFGPIMTPGSLSIERTAPLKRRSMEYALNFRSSATYLKTLFPIDSFSFVSAGTVANATFKYRESVTSDQFGIRTTRALSLHLHHVQFRRADGSTMVGSFLPVYFTSGDEYDENKSVHLGLPKVQCNLESRRIGNTFYVVGSWRGNTFLRLTFSDLDTVPSNQQATSSHDNYTASNSTRAVKFSASDTTSDGLGVVAKESLATDKSSLPTGNKSLVEERPDNGTPVQVANNVDRPIRGPPRGPPRIPDEVGTLWYNYVPSVGQPGQTDAAYTVFAPFNSSEKTETLEEGSVGDIEWFEGDWKSLPSIHHIIKGLAHIPIYSITKASLKAYKGDEDLLHAKKVE